jgi:hypothetical protein
MNPSADTKGGLLAGAAENLSPVAVLGARTSSRAAESGLPRTETAVMEVRRLLP